MEVIFELMGHANGAVPFSGEFGNLVSMFATSPISQR